eukprot:jgi/Picre1/31608/NNA_006960.t1
MKTEGSLTTRVIDSASSAVSTVKNAFVKPSGNLEKVQNLFITELRDRDSEFLLVAGSENTLRTGFVGARSYKTRDEFENVMDFVGHATRKGFLSDTSSSLRGRISNNIFGYSI